MATPRTEHPREFYRTADVLALIDAKGARPESPTRTFGRSSAARHTYNCLRHRRFVTVFAADEVLTPLGLHIDMLESVSVISGGGERWEVAS